MVNFKEKPSKSQEKNENDSFFIVFIFHLGNLGRRFRSLLRAAKALIL